MRLLEFRCFFFLWLDKSISSNSHQSCHCGPKVRVHLLCSAKGFCSYAKKKIWLLNEAMSESTTWICKKLLSAATAYLHNSLSKWASELKNSQSKPGSSFPLPWISYYSVFKKFKTWSENVIHTMGLHPIYYLIIWQNLHSKMEFNKPCLLPTILWKTWKLTAGLKPLFIEYQNVPATWKQMYKWIRNLNTDTSKLRGNLREAGLVPGAHNSKSHCYLNFP